MVVETVPPRVTLPGPDGEIGTDDDVTIQPAGIDDVDRGTGTITVPDGSVVSTNGVPLVIPDVNDGLPPGTFPPGTIILPDGTIVVPADPKNPGLPKVKDDGTIDVGPGDTIITPPYDDPYTVEVPGGKFDPTIPGFVDGNTVPPTVTHIPSGVKIETVPPRVTVPGPDGEIGTKDDVVIQPAGVGDVDPKTGIVTVPEGSAVSTNGVPLVIDGVNNDNLPEGSFPKDTIILPDGTIIVPGSDPSTVKINDDGTVDVSPGDIVIHPPYDAPYTVETPGGTYDPSVPGVILDGDPKEVIEFPYIGRLVSITVDTPPAVNYVVGATLDLSALVVILTYDSGKVVTVPFANFTQHGITTSPVNGTVLTTAYNGSPISVIGKGVSTIVGNLSVSAVAVNGIAIKAQPATLSYNAGDTLSLAGLVVTLTYNSGATADVPFANFTSFGIVATPANGTALTTAHNGTLVTVACGGLTAATANLAVTALNATLYYNANGGANAPANQVVAVGATTQVSTAVPDYTGFTFQGWSENQAATTATYVGGNTIVMNADKTLYAVWKFVEPGVGSDAFTASGFVEMKRVVHTNGKTYSLIISIRNQATGPQDSIPSKLTEYFNSSACPQEIKDAAVGVTDGAYGNNTVSSPNPGGIATPFTLSHAEANAWDGRSNNAVWWLRASSGHVVNNNGALTTTAATSSFGIRPAFWVELKTRETPAVPVAQTDILSSGFTMIKTQQVGGNDYALIVKTSNYGTAAQGLAPEQLSAFINSTDNSFPQVIRNAAVGADNALSGYNTTSTPKPSASAEVFVLSYAEANAWGGRDNGAVWWLRAPSGHVVNNNGALTTTAVTSSFGVRPAMWVALKTTRETTAVPVTYANIYDNGFKVAKTQQVDGNYYALIVKTSNYGAAAQGLIPGRLGAFVTSTDNSFPQIIRNAAVGADNALFGYNTTSTPKPSAPADVFVLSYVEANAWALNERANNAVWWLRAPSGHVVNNNGALTTTAVTSSFGVRPAMWVAYDYTP